MANVYKYGPNDWEITFDNTADIDMASTAHLSNTGGRCFPKGVCLKQVQIYGTAGDVVGIRDGAAGPLIAKFKDVNGAGVAKIFRSHSSDGSKQYRHLYIDTDDCTVSSSMVIMIEFDE